MTGHPPAAVRDILEDTLLPRDTRRSLPILLLRARDKVMSSFRPILARHDLSEQQWRVMRVLSEVDRMDSREAAERACVLAPSLTRIIRALEARRLITRDRHSDDARRIYLAITPAGIDMIKVLSREGRATFTQLQEKYGTERLEELIDMLSDLVTLER